VIFRRFFQQCYGDKNYDDAIAKLSEQVMEIYGSMQTLSNQCIGLQRQIQNSLCS
jgi:hypothetical protein